MVVEPKAPYSWSVPPWHTEGRISLLQMRTNQMKRMTTMTSR